MEDPRPIVRRQLGAAGYELGDAVGQGACWVRDAHGVARVATALQLTDAAAWETLRPLLMTLHDLAHENVVGLRDAVPVRRSGAGPAGPVSEVVLVWDLQDVPVTLAQVLASQALGAPEVSAVVIATARAVVAVRGLGAAAGEAWAPEEVVIGTDGGLRRWVRDLQPGAAPDDTAAVQAIAAGCRALLRAPGVPAADDAEARASLRRLLAEAAESTDPPSPGTLAALSHRAAHPAEHGVWRRRRALAATVVDGGSAEGARAPRAGEPASGTSSPVRTWREALRDAGAGPAPGTRSRRPRTPTRRATRRRGLLASAVVAATACCVVVAGGVIDGGSGADDAGGAEEAARRLTERRVDILSELATGLRDGGGAADALDDVLLAGSEAHAADLRLVERLTAAAPRAATVQARTSQARLIEREGAQATVRVDYELFSGAAGADRREATLRLVHTGDGWRVASVAESG